MRYGTVAKTLMAVMFVFFVFTGLLFSGPVKAGTDWACKKGGTTLSNYISKVEKKGTRFSLTIKGEGKFQNTFLLFENGYAEARIFVDQCAFMSVQISADSIVETFDLDLKQIFPVLKKGSF